MNPQEIITQLMKHNNCWNDQLHIQKNKNIRGQSTSYFISHMDKALYIAKFFDYMKDITIPENINIATCNDTDELIEKLAYTDEFMGNIEEVSDLIYFSKRCFNQYILVSREKNIGFPHIIAFDTNIKLNNHFYGLLIEEAIAGITLEEYLKSNIQNECRLLFSIQFLWELCQIIEKFVQHGIVHRDLSPDNIMIKDNIFYIIDPGMVKIIERHSTQLGYVMGKFEYASPEQFYGHALYADFTSDLYSIGLIAFEIISGINPLKKYLTSADSKISPHEELLKKYDRELEDLFFNNIEENKRSSQLFLIIKKMLQVDKSYRFDSINSFKESLKIIKEDI